VKREAVDRPIDEDGKKKRSYSKPKLTKRNKLKNVTAGLLGSG